MASRKSSDLYCVLELAYIYGKQQWDILYPTMPQPFLTCSHRPFSEQNELYRQGRTTKGRKVTNARGGESPHNFLPALAFDIAFIKPDGKTLDWNKDLFEKFYNIIRERYPDVIWGGSWVKFKDLPHFELRTWKEMKGQTVV